MTDMSSVSSENYRRVSVHDTLLQELAVIQANSAARESFNAHLERAKKAPDRNDATGNDVRRARSHDESSPTEQPQEDPCDGDNAHYTTGETAVVPPFAPTAPAAPGAGASEPPTETSALPGDGLTKAASKRRASGESATQATGRRSAANDEATGRLAAREASPTALEAPHPPPGSSEDPVIANTSAAGDQADVAVAERARALTQPTRKLKPGEKPAAKPDQANAAEGPTIVQEATAKPIVKKDGSSKNPATQTLTAKDDDAPSTNAKEALLRSPAHRSDGDRTADVSPADDRSHAGRAKHGDAKSAQQVDATADAAAPANATTTQNAGSAAAATAMSEATNLVAPIAAAASAAATTAVETTTSTATASQGNNAANAVAAAQRSPRGTTAATSTAERGANAESSQAERVRFVQRVAGAFRTMADRGGAVRMKLSPPELGNLRIEISVRSGQMSAKVETDNAETRKLMLDSLPMLRDRLAEQGVKIQAFDVTTGNGSSGGSFQQFAGNTAAQQQGGGQGQPALPRGPASSAAETPADAPTARAVDADGRLNVVV